MSLRTTHLITSLDADGAQICLLRLLSQLGDRSGAMDVICLTGEGPVAATLREIGIPVRSLGMRGGRSAPRGLVTLARILRQERPDVLVTWLYHANVLGSLAAGAIRAAAPPVVWNIAHSTFEPRHAKIQTRIVVRLSSRIAQVWPRQVVFCSDVSRTLHCESGYPADRSVFLPNGFDLEQFRPSAAMRAEVRRELHVPEGAPLLGIVGRFHPDKDHGNFAAAAGRVLRRCPDAHFLLAGRGMSVENTPLISMLQDADVVSRCRLLGPRGDVGRLMSSLDLYVSSSCTEAFPNVLGEAMASAVPCVATDVGDCRHILGETGRIVPPRDPGRLADSCLAFLALPAESRVRLGEAARSRIAQHFDLRHTAQRHHAVWQAAAGATTELRTAASKRAA